MFPFVPIDSQTGDVDVFGNPVHGLYEFFYGDPVAESFSFIDVERSRVTTSVLDESSQPKQVPRNHFFWPGTPDARIFDTGNTFTRDPALADYDKLHANEWRDTAIINGGRFYHRTNATTGTWMYVAPDGTVWGIAISGSSGASFTVHDPNRLKMLATIHRYGLIKYPNSFWGILDEPDEEFNDDTALTYAVERSAGLTDFDSLTGGLTGIFMDANHSGSQALIGVGNLTFNTNSFNHVALGDSGNVRKTAGNVSLGGNTGTKINVVYLVTVSGTPHSESDPFSMTVDVHRDQATCAGTVATNKNVEVRTTVWGAGYGGTGGTGDPFFRPNLAPTPGGFTPTFLFSTQLGNSSKGPEARRCGWERLDCSGASLLDRGLGDSGEDTFRWWIFDAGEIDIQPLGVPWKVSREYTVGNQVLSNGFSFTCTVAHTTDALLQPGESAAWQDNWEIEHDPEEHDIADVPRWAEATSYSTFDPVHDGAGSYYISKGLHTSFDSTAEDPEEEDFSQPGVGSVWERFWDGPHTALLSGAAWLPSRMMVKDWIIPQSYTEGAFAGDNVIDNATWKVKKAHVSDVTNKPGSGANWPQFWEQATTHKGSGDRWQPPVRYGEGVNRVNQGFDPNKVYVATAPHTSTLANQPPSASWEEDTEILDCTDVEFNPFGGTGGLNDVAYHVEAHSPKTQSMDFKIDGIFGWAHFKEDGSIKEYTVDVQYTRELIDNNFTHCWNDNDVELVPESSAEFWNGSTTRLGASVTETLLYNFRVEGTLRHDIFLRAIATASGQEDWTETFDSIQGLGWNAESSYTLDVLNDGLTHSSISDNMTDANAGGSGTPPKFSTIPMDSKGSWSTNDFVSGWTFRYIDNPYFDNVRIAMQNAVSLDLPGADLLHFKNQGVPLAAISTSTDEQFEARPTRTADQAAQGLPAPSIYFITYSRKLVGPLVIGHKAHANGTDAQYLGTAEPVDFPWKQYGVFGPDAESPNTVSLTQRSPLVGIVTWLKNADYGDDISCAYDPFTKTIERNSQYKVTFI